VRTKEVEPLTPSPSDRSGSRVHRRYDITLLQDMVTNFSLNIKLMLEDGSACRNDGQSLSRHTPLDQEFDAGVPTNGIREAICYID
jgi:hypothetical protein